MAQLTEHLAKYVKMYRAVLAQNAKMFIELGSTVEIVQTVWQVIESASADVSKIDGGKNSDRPGTPPAQHVTPLAPMADQASLLQKTCTRCTPSGLWSSL